MPSLGEILKQRRIQLGLTLEKIEDETKIRKYYIAALEEDNYSQLPAKVYAIGFVKKYADMLDLDDEQVVKEFKRIAYHDDSRDKDEVTMAETSREIFKVPVKNVLTGLVFLAVIAWIGVYLMDYMVGQGIKNTAKRPPAVEEKKNTTAKKTVPVPEKTPPVKEGVNLTITGVYGDCWLRAVVDDQQTTETTLRPGDVKKIAATREIALVLGNAGNVKVEYNGQDLGQLGKQGAVVRTQFPPPADNPLSSNNQEVPTTSTGEHPIE